MEIIKRNPVNLVLWLIAYVTGKPPDAGNRSNRFSGMAQLFLGLRFRENIICVWYLLRPSRQGPMGVATEITSGILIYG